MYRWRKFASSQWLIRHETPLQAKTNNGLVIIQSPNRKKLRLEVSSSSRQLVESLLAQFGGEIERLPQNWRDRFAVTAKIKPLRIGTHLTIRSAGKSKPGQLIIPAAGAFGTGEHATTAMCLRLLERVSRRWIDWSILDAGTGTGIFALAAKCFGAQSVVAVDNDPKAIAVAKSNARINGIHGIRFEIADAKKLKMRRKVDVITANLFSELLIALIAKWRELLKSKGILILSGVLRSQERDVLRALRKQRIAIEEIRRRGKWVAILARSQKAS